MAAYALVDVEAVVDELHHVGCSGAQAFGVAGGGVREVWVLRVREVWVLRVREVWGAE